MGEWRSVAVCDAELRARRALIGPVDFHGESQHAADALDSARRGLMAALADAFAPSPPQLGSEGLA